MFVSSSLSCLGDSMQSCPLLVFVCLICLGEFTELSTVFSFCLLVPGEFTELCAMFVSCLFNPQVSH